MSRKNSASHKNLMYRILWFFGMPFVVLSVYYVLGKCFSQTQLFMNLKPTELAERCVRQYELELQLEKSERELKLHAAISHVDDTQQQKMIIKKVQEVAEIKKDLEPYHDSISGRMRIPCTADMKFLLCMYFMTFFCACALVCLSIGAYDGLLWGCVGTACAIGIILITQYIVVMIFVPTWYGKMGAVMGMVLICTILAYTIKRSL